MNAEEAKAKITDILQSVVNCDERYVLNGKYVKWGAVEADIHAVIDSLPTPLALDGDITPDNQQVLPADVLAGEGTLPEPPRQ